MAACPNAAIPLAVIKNPELPHFAGIPNPARNFVTVKLNNTSTLEISNQMGILIETIQTRGLQECHLDISQWEAGLYLKHYQQIKLRHGQSWLFNKSYCV